MFVSDISKAALRIHTVSCGSSDMQRQQRLSVMTMNRETSRRILYVMRPVWPQYTRVLWRIIVAGRSDNHLARPEGRSAVRTAQEKLQFASVSCCCCFCRCRSPTHVSDLLASLTRHPLPFTRILFRSRRICPGFEAWLWAAALGPAATGGPCSPGGWSFEASLCLRSSLKHCGVSAPRQTAAQRKPRASSTL